MRDIATDAEVSLTLVNYYFGTKANLLHAVVDGHRLICIERMAKLTELVIGDDVPITLETLVSEWVKYEYDLYTSPDGEHYLMLMLKLANEIEVDLSVQRRLNCSEAVVLQGFKRASPNTTSDCRMKAFRSSSAALHTGILDYGIAVDSGRVNAEEEAIAFSARFLYAGLAASFV